MATIKINLIIPFIFMILCFLSQKEIFPLSVYLILAVSAAIYFFPVRVILLLKGTKGSQSVLYTFSNFLFALLLGLSASYLYLDGNRTLRTIIEDCGIILFFLALYYTIKKKDSFNFLLHLFFSSFTPFIIIT